MTQKLLLNLQYSPHSDLSKEIHACKARFRLLNCGRRFGKTFLEIAEAFMVMVNRMLYYKEQGLTIQPRGWVVAPTYPLVMEEWRAGLHIFEDVLLPGSQGVKKSEKRFIFKYGIGELEFKSADDKDANLRGAGLDVAVMAEAARISREAWEQGVRPALADRRGIAILGSTPKGRNWFYDAYVKGMDPKNKLWQAWKIPSIKNPYFPIEEWKELEATLPQHIFQQEFMAEFLEDSNVVFRGFKSRIAGDFEDPVPGHQYVMGVDLAKTVDFTVIFILDTTTMHFVYFHRFQEIDWPLQKKMIYWKAKEYNNATISIDSTGVGDPIVADLERNKLNVMGFKFTNVSKKELVELGIIAIQQGWITYPEVEEFLNEMMAFEYQLLPSGKFKYCAPEGLHDDCVIAFLLALWPNREMFYKRDKIQIAKPPAELDDRSYEFWLRQQEAKQRAKQSQQTILDDM